MRTLAQEETVLCFGNKKVPKDFVDSLEATVESRTQTKSTVFQR